MRNITLTLYKFDELNEKSQKRALEKVHLEDFSLLDRRTDKELQDHIKYCNYEFDIEGNLFNLPY